MKKKTIKSKLNLNKSVISKFTAAKVKGGGTRGCGPTWETDYCDATLTGSMGMCPTQWTCPIT